VVSSSCCKDISDSPGRYTLKLPMPLKTTGEWSVAVQKYSIPKFWYNLTTGEVITFTVLGSAVAHVLMPPGCYENIKVLIDTIAKRTEDGLKSLGSYELTKMPHIWYDSPSRACCMFTGEVDGRQPLGTIFSAKLLKMLGFDTFQNTEIYQKERSMFSATERPCLDPPEKGAYINTNLAQGPLDFINFQSLKNTKTPSQLQFHPVRLSEVNAVTVQLLDVKGYPVIIRKGDTSVKLIFRSYENGN
jgi:hypothetical protein